MSAENTIEVPNHWGLGDGTPLIIESNPNVIKIFSDENPPVPQKITDKNREYWQKEEIKVRHVALAIAYMQHPDSAVRKMTIEICGDLKAIGVYQELIDRLADPDASVRHAAAINIWRRDKNDYCKFALHALRDEIKGHPHLNDPTIRPNLTLGREKAIQAIDLLIKEAPDETSRKAIQELIEKDEIIEERKKNIDDYLQQLVAVARKHAGKPSCFGISGKKETIEIGNEIYENFGITGMRYICEQIKRERLYFGASREIESVWDGIGGWRG